VGPALRVVVEGCLLEGVVVVGSAADVGATEEAAEEAEAEAEADEAEADEEGSADVNKVEFPPGSGTASPSLIDEADPLISP
jgi:hypothetical protein